MRKTFFFIQIFYTGRNIDANSDDNSYRKTSKDGGVILKD